MSELSNQAGSGWYRFVILGVATLAFAAAVGLTRFGYTLVLPGMQAGLGLSAGQMGLIAGLSLTSYLLCSVPAGVLATRFGTRRVVAGGLALSAVGLGATGLAQDLPTAAAAQILSGGSAAGVIVPVLSVGARWFAPSQWGRATGVVVGGGGIGLLATGLVVPLLLGPDPAAGWRAAWFGLAGAVLATGLLAALVLRDPARFRRGSAARPGSVAGQLGLVYRSGRVWHLGLIFLCYGWAYITFGTFFAAHLAADIGLQSAEIGRLWSLTGLVGIGGGLLSGALADRLGARLTLVVLFACQGVSEATLALGEAEPALLGAALLYGLTVWSFSAVISTACAQVVGPALGPAAVSLAVVLMSVGQALGPTVGGLLADRFGSFGPALLLAAGFDLAGLLLAAALRLPPTARAAPAYPKPAGRADRVEAGRIEGGAA